MRRRIQLQEVEVLLVLSGRLAASTPIACRLWHPKPHIQQLFLTGQCAIGGRFAEASAHFDAMNQAQQQYIEKKLTPILEKLVRGLIARV